MIHQGSHKNIVGIFAGPSEAVRYLRMSEGVRDLRFSLRRKKQEPSLRAEAQRGSPYVHLRHDYSKVHQDQQFCDNVQAQLRRVP
ncbi:putative fucosyltransferase 7 isoform X2 [Panicum miliaceum]|uniref:Fucosyltransferase 7 isoform X2 n=1 Tax=Panicum miliaceum TaxID=4540 RepID=A0A3L6QMI1_PANMI|nr:putative fucosyltransferase 7 isoform X2 [Panicum miliaceum]